MSVGTRGFSFVVVIAAALVPFACASGPSTCDTGVNNVELCTEWVDSKNATREACGEPAVLDAEEACESYDALDDPNVCGDCTEYFACLSSLTTCEEGVLTEGSISDCPSSCD